MVRFNGQLEMRQAMLDPGQVGEGRRACVECLFQPCSGILPICYFRWTVESSPDASCGTLDEVEPPAALDPKELDQPFAHRFPVRAGSGGRSGSGERAIPFQGAEGAIGVPGSTDRGAEIHESLGIGGNFDAGQKLFRQIPEVHGFFR